MENRIRQKRKERGLTLADLASRCEPATTAQTIGRLETGMRTVSLDWIRRIAQALDLPPGELLTEPGDDSQAPVTARMTAKGIEALDNIETVSLPRFGDHARIVTVTETFADYRAGDLLWFESIAPDRLIDAVNSDILLPGRAGHFHFGRLAAVEGNRATLLPPRSGATAQHVEGFAWAARLRKLIRNFE